MEGLQIDKVYRYAECSIPSPLGGGAMERLKKVSSIVTEEKLVIFSENIERCHDGYGDKLLYGLSELMRNEGLNLIVIKL